MKIYKVGGCVRDTLLGVEPKDIDFVVVGSTPEEMLSLGFQQVGASFPVFLKDGCEYALARTERKVGVGYHGFETFHDVSVTLEDDLLRRDLTINSMAMDENGTIIDPYDGHADLAAGILRHTSEAFAEDPVRVLRTARFAARYGFQIANETLDLMEKIAPELDHVPAERIWAEIERGLMEAYPHKMFDALFEIDVFEFESMRPYNCVSREILKSIRPEHGLITRFVLISSSFEDADYIQCRVPNDCALVSLTFNKMFARFVVYASLDDINRLEILYSVRAFNNRWLLNQCLDALKLYSPMSPTQEQIIEDLSRIDTVNAAVIAASCKSGVEIKKNLYQARLDALSD